jgi:hypothetical protein
MASPLTAERSTTKISGLPLPPTQGWPMKGSTTIYKGSLVMLNGGYAAPGAAATGRVAVGRAAETKTNSGADGAVDIAVEPGIFVWDNLAGNLVTQAIAGTVCYADDDHTVTSLATGRSPAGVVKRVRVDGSVEVLSGLGLNA